MFRTRNMRSVQNFVPRVQMNAQNTTIRIVKNVLKFAASAQRHVINQSDKANEIFFKFYIGNHCLRSMWK